MKIIYSKKAIKELKKQTKATSQVIVNAIRQVPKGDIKDLKGFGDGRKRLRVGKYRVIFRITNDQSIEVLYVIDIGTRGDIYKS